MTPLQIDHYRHISGYHYTQIDEKQRLKELVFIATKPSLISEGTLLETLATHHFFDAIANAEQRVLQKYWLDFPEKDREQYKNEMFPTNDSGPSYIRTSFSYFFGGG